MSVDCNGRNRVRSVASPNGPLTGYLPSITIAGLTPVMGAIPSVGEHTDTIMAELGVKADVSS